MLLPQDKLILFSLFLCSMYIFISKKHRKRRKEGHTWECDLAAKDRLRCIFHIGLHDRPSTIHTGPHSYFHHVNEILLALERANPFGIIWTTHGHFLSQSILAVDFDVSRIIEEENCWY